MAGREISSVTPKDAFVGDRRVRETEFPIDPEERMAALLASINGAPKSIVINLLPANGYISPKELGENFVSIVGNKNVLGRNPMTNVTGYCIQTLCPIGLVAEEYVLDSFGKEEVVGFGLTEEGKRYGIPAACFALSFESRNNSSLYSVLGATNSTSKNRAPYARAKILQFLYSQERPVREIDIERNLNFSHALVEGSLLAMRNTGAVKYEAVSSARKNVQVTYEMSDKTSIKVDGYENDPGLYMMIARICQKLGDAGITITGSTVYENISKKIKSKWKKSRRSTISAVLTSLAAQGFLSRGKFKGGENYSVVEIDTLGRLVVEEVLAPLGDVVRDATADNSVAVLASEVLSNLSSFSRTSMELYYPYSIGYKRKKREQNIRRMYDLIKENPGIDTPSLMSTLGLTGTPLRKHLTQMEKDGRIRSEKVRGFYRYYPAGN